MEGLRREIKDEGNVLSRSDMADGGQGSLGHRRW